MPTPERGGAIRQFRGLDQRRILAASLQETESLDNVIVRNGTVYGRRGISLHGDVTTPASDLIIGLFAFLRAASKTEMLLRMLPTKLELFSGGAWVDVTGTALNGTSTTRPQSTVHDDALMFTNEGADRPRKYTGTGNSAQLGGTPPFCKAIESYEGFVFLGNVSDDGSTYFPTEIRYSDNPDGDWTLCDGNSLDIKRQSPGDIMVLKRLGRHLIAYTSEGIVTITFTGGTVRFNQERVPFPMGIISPLCVISIGERGHIFLATDLNLYITNGQTVQPLPFNLQEALQVTMPQDFAKFTVGVSDDSTSTCHVLYQTSSDDEWLRGRLSYNYVTKEFFRGHWDGHQFTRAVYFKADPDTKGVVIAAASDPDNLVYDMETGVADALTDTVTNQEVKRIYDTDWQSFGSPGDKWLGKVNLTFRRKKNCVVRISCAADFKYDLPNISGPLDYPKTFDLINQKNEITYDIPSPLYGDFHNVRIEMFHKVTENVVNDNVVELQQIVPVMVSVTPVDKQTAHPAGSTSGTGI